MNPSVDTTRLSLALFLVGFVTFALLYDVQPLLPLITHSYGRTARAGAWVMALSTAGMAVSIMAVNLLATPRSRRFILFSGLLSAALLSLLMAWVHSFKLLLMTRALIGLALGAIPVLAMAELGDAIAPDRLGRAVGVYVSGTALGGMSGRLAASLLVMQQGWQNSLFLLGLAGLFMAYAAATLWPRSILPSGVSVPPPLAEHLRIWRMLWRQRLIRHYDLIALLLMGCFITAYNGVAYHLLHTPSPAAARRLGMLYSVYLVGVIASMLAGRAADRWGDRRSLLTATALLVLGLVIDLLPNLAALIVGMALVTFAFFAGHAVASTAVARRARPHAAHAAALYLLFYYGGSSLISVLGGAIWDRGAWTGLIFFLIVLALLAFALATTRSPPLALSPQLAHDPEQGKTAERAHE